MEFTFQTPPLLANHSEPAPQHFPLDPLDSPQAPYCLLWWPATLAGALTYPQDSEVTGDHQTDPDLPISYLSVSVSYYFAIDDEVLKDFAKGFLHWIHEKREHSESW